MRRGRRPVARRGGAMRGRPAPRRMARGGAARGRRPVRRMAHGGSHCPPGMTQTAGGCKPMGYRRGGRTRPVATRRFAHGGSHGNITLRSGNTATQGGPCPAGQELGVQGCVPAGS